MEKVLLTREDNDKFFFGTPVIAFLDILGFSDLVKYNAHATLVHLYKTLVSSPVRTYNDFHQFESKIKTEKFGENANLSGLRLLNISDSIIVWIDNSKETSILDLLYGVKTLMTISINLGIPMRGCVTMGQFDVFEENGNISIVGRALVRAYEIEREQQWSGCVVEDNIFTFLRSFQEVVLERNSKPVIENIPNLLIHYDEIPFKSGIKKGYVINWKTIETLNEDVIRDSFSMYNKRTNENEIVKKSIELKIENTIKFFNYCKQNTP